MFAAIDVVIRENLGKIQFKKENNYLHRITRKAEFLDDV